MLIDYHQQGFEIQIEKAEQETKKSGDKPAFKLKFPVHQLIKCFELLA